MWRKEQEEDKGENRRNRKNIGEAEKQWKRIGRGGRNFEDAWGAVR